MILKSILLALSATLTAEHTFSQGFVERAAPAGLAHAHESGYDRVGFNGTIIDWCQSGVALGDLDGDGDLDVVACGGVLPHHVFRNDGTTFTDVSKSTGIAADDFERTPALGDYDGDGDLDLFLGALAWGDGRAPGRSRLFRNEGGFSFVEVTALAGTTGFGHTIHAKWNDLDLDGLLDLYLGEFHGTSNAFYRNNGDGTFTELGAEHGVDNHGSSHVVAVVDTDVNGLPDVYVANDYPIGIGVLTNIATDGVLAGQLDGSFVDVGFGSGANQLATSMGMAFGDVDYDGLLDIYKTEFSSNYLLLNRGWPQVAIPWVQVQSAYGVQNAIVFEPETGFPLGHEVGWGTAFAHLDLDPWIDLVLINGRVANSPCNQRNYIYRGANAGSATPFTDTTANWGFLDHIDDRGLAVGDVDADGDLDLFVTPVTGPLRFFENRLDRAHQSWLSVQAQTTTSAPGGAGTRVRWIDRLGLPHVRVISAGAPTASQSQGRAFFGLGHEKLVDVEVTFPSGLTLTHANTPGDTLLVSTEPELIRLASRTATTFDADQAFEVRAFAHDENGAMLDGNATVSIEMDGLLPLSDVQHVTANEFVRAFRLPKHAGEFRARVTFDGFEVRIRPRLVVRGAWNPDTSTIRLTPTSVRAGTADEIAVTVAPKDALGIALGPGHAATLTIHAPSGDQTTLLTDQGDGRYSSTLSAFGAAGTHPLSLTIDGVSSAPTSRLNVAGAADPDASRASLYREFREGVHLPASPHRMRVFITPRDSAGRRLGPRADVRLTVDHDPDSVKVDVVRSGSGAQQDGDFYFLMERDARSREGAATGTFSIEVDGVIVINGEPFAF